MNVGEEAVVEDAEKAVRKLDALELLLHVLKTVTCIETF
jgi:hypothetical protein